MSSTAAERTGPYDLLGLDRHLADLNSQILTALNSSLDPSFKQDPARLVGFLADIDRLRNKTRKVIDKIRAGRTAALRIEIASLRRVKRSDELLAKVCESVVHACGFDRAMLSRIDGSTWHPWKTYSRASTATDAHFQRWMNDVPAIRLEHMMVESEMVRRHEPAIVIDGSTDRRIHPPFRLASGLTSYVAAPLMPDGRVIGLLHADYYRGPVDLLDRDALWSFAEAFGSVFERAVTLERLAKQSSRVRTAMQTIEELLDELATEEIALAPMPHGPSYALTMIRPGESGHVVDSRWHLTTREIEVLAIMATGATNSRIAERLVITDGTVKSHVKKILRKLGVDNRGAAIALYLRRTIPVAPTNSSQSRPAEDGERTDRRRST